MMLYTLNIIADGGNQIVIEEPPVATETVETIQPIVKPDTLKNIKPRYLDWYIYLGGILLLAIVLLVLYRFFKRRK